MADATPARGAQIRRVSLIASIGIFVALFIWGMFIVAGALQGFKPDVFMAPIRLTMQILLQLPPFALIIVIISHILVIGLLVRMLAVERLRTSNLFYVAPACVILLGAYWFMSCRGIVKFIEKLGQ